MLFIRLMKNSNIFGCPKKCHTFLTAHDFCLARSSHLKFVYNSNQTCFTHEYKISLKLINYEKMVGLWNWYLFLENSAWPPMMRHYFKVCVKKIISVKLKVLVTNIYFIHTQWNNNFLCWPNKAKSNWNMRSVSEEAPFSHEAGRHLILN